MLPKQANISGESLFFLFFYSLVLIVMAFAVVAETSNVIDRHADVSGLLFSLYPLRILFSSDCLAYTDVRSHPGIVDLRHFNSIYLDACLVRNGFGARLTLRYGDNERLAYLNKEVYEVLQPLCFDVSYSCTSVSRSVLVRDGESLTQGTLLIDLAFDRGVKT